MRTLTDLGTLRHDQAAAHLVGMPWEHAQVFMQIARQEKCVLSSRQLGRVCTGLMREGYDTKGFRMKSKSCDFGPMAGFICLDERLHKKGAAYNPTQKKDVEHALHGDDWDRTGRWKATSEQICLTENRFQELRNWNDPTIPDALINPAQVTPDICVGTHARPVQIYYLLRREERFGDKVWALYYSDNPIPRTPVTYRAAWAAVVAGCGLRPLMALVNPYPPYPRGHYKNCCTGDYDLFGVWPLKRLRGSDALPQGHRLATPAALKPTPFQALGEDRRIAGMALNNTNAQIVQFEDKRLGNTSNRVHTVAQLINSAIHATVNGGRGAVRDVIHHSDEAGRPFINGIDDHVIAFVPAPGRNIILGVESPGGNPNAHQWTAFFRAVDDLGFQVVANAHWLGQMNAWGVANLATTGDARGWRPAQNDPVRST